MAKNNKNKNKPPAPPEPAQVTQVPSSFGAFVQQQTGQAKKNLNKGRVQRLQNQYTQLSAPAASGPPAGTSNIVGQSDEDFIKSIAEEQPLDYATGQFRQTGQLTGAGPATYENWLQNQYFNQLYGDYMGQLSNGTQDFKAYMAANYTPDKARNAYNALTPTQRGEGFNPFSGGTGRWTLWG